jgi:N4-gp56 family major capsid protein
MHTEFGTNHPLTVKRWSLGLFRETFGKMGITKLIGKGPEACIQLLTDLDKGAGDTVYYDLLAQDRSPGVNGDARLKGNEAPMTFFQDTLRINQKRHAHSFLGMTQQRTNHQLRVTAKFSLSQWWAWVIEAGLMAHFAGKTGDGNESVFGPLAADTGSADFAGNTITALDAGHLVDRGGSGAIITMLDTAVAKAKVQNPRMAPLMIGGEPKYIAYFHPYQIMNIKADTGAAGWLEIQKNAGVRGASNAIYTGALGEYNGVIIRESEFIPRDGSVSHGFMLGQGAGAIAFGNAWKKQSRAGAGGGTFFDWKESMDDYDNEEGVGSASILGMKRSIFNGKALGVMGLRSTEADPT